MLFTVACLQMNITKRHQCPFVTTFTLTMPAFFHLQRDNFGRQNTCTLTTADYKERGDCGTHPE